MKLIIFTKLHPNCTNKLFNAPKKKLYENTTSCHGDKYLHQISFVLIHCRTLNVSIDVYVLNVYIHGATYQIIINLMNMNKLLIGICSILITSCSIVFSANYKKPKKQKWKRSSKEYHISWKYIKNAKNIKYYGSYNVAYHMHNDITVETSYTCCIACIVACLKHLTLQLYLANVSLYVCFHVDTQTFLMFNTYIICKLNHHSIIKQWIQHLYINVTGAIVL